jgi:Flp pilus assembly protein TadD
MSRDDWTAAQRHLEAAVESQPDSASAHQALGVVLQKRGLVGRASFHFQQARRLSGGAP